MNIWFLTLLIVIQFSGCATTDYNPVAAGTTQQTFLLNETAFSKISVGMGLPDVHELMGETIVIGYTYQKPLMNESTGLPNPTDSAAYKPMTITNPYKTEHVKTKEGDYLVEFYVNAINQSDGVISEDELVPLVFRDSLLVAKGWDYLKALRLKNLS